MGKLYAWTKNSFLKAIEKDDAAAVKRLVKKHPQLLDKMELFCHPLLLALQNKSPTCHVVRTLLEECDLPPDTIQDLLWYPDGNYDHFHVLRDAIDNKREDAADAIIRNDPKLKVDETTTDLDTNPITALLNALSNGLAKTSSLLLQKGADIHYVPTTFNKRNAMHWAAWGTPETIDIAYAHLSSELDSQESEGRTPLLEALRLNKTDNALHLINLGCDVHIPDNKGMTTLMQNAKTGAAPEITHALLAKGMRPDTKDNEGLCAVHYISVDPISPKNTAQTREETLVLLISHGGDVNARDDKKRTPLMHAAMNGMEDSVISLLKHGADPTIPDIRGSLPSFWASKDSIKALLLEAEKSWQERIEAQERAVELEKAARIAERASILDTFNHGANKATVISTRKIVLRQQMR